MAIPAPVPTPVALPESLPQDNANESFQTGMEIDVRAEVQPATHMLEVRAEDGHEPVVKKLKRVHGEVEMVLRQTAEIVMVLVGVSALRGGAQPSPLECQLASQAYEKLATLVTVSAPQDLVSKNALQSLIQQLTVPPPPPARPAAKSVAIQSPTPPLAPAPAPAPAPTSGLTPSSSPSLSKAAAQAGASASTPSPSPSPSISPSPSPAPGLFSSLSNASAPPVSVASSTRASESGPAVVPAPASKAVASGSKAVASAPKTGSSVPSPALAKVKPSALEQVQTSSSSLDIVAPSVTPSPVPATSINVPVATSTTPPITLRSKSGGRTSPVKQQGTPTAEVQPTTTVTIKDQRGNQAPKALARQRGLKNTVPEQPVVSDPLETHRQIAVAVQLLLKPYIVTTALTKTAGNYMSTSIPCGICKVVVNTTNNVLICDGCECGFHLQCLQLSSTTSIPKGDWYCPKCITNNSGRQQPPKYGPLRRAGPAGQSGSKNSWSMQAGRGIDASKGQTPGKLVSQSRKKEVDAVQDSVEPLSSALEACATAQPETVARRHSMEEYARVRAHVPNSAGVPEQEASEQSLKLEWLGPVLSSGQEKLYYSACCVGGVTMRLQDAAFFRPEASDVPPYIARLQALWEDKNSGQKWVKVNWCYYPSDLPVNMGRPVINDPREVYESNHSDNNLVGSIQGPCLVLPPSKYQEELDRRSKNPKEDPIPLFLCQWFYDAPKGLFRASSDA